MAKLLGKVSAHSEQDGRPYQEDRLVLIKKEISDQESGWLLAVMDGHVGPETAEFCAKNLESFFDRALGSKKEQVDEDVLRETISLLNESTRHLVTGSTISLAFVSETNSKVLVAVLGDSPVIVLDHNGEVHISPEHNVRTNISERKAAVARGAYYANGYIWGGWREEQGLQMARALGDNDFDAVLSREPEIYRVDLGSDSFIIVASDGVFDPGHSETTNQIERIVEVIKKTPTFDAKDLVNDAISRQTQDNATAIIWRA
ncbi:MAG: PP2C family serine/threonine-protein phosphatase [bacterium]|nr:PP2C family serine/threonine-protein phosphatase [bacterium]